MKILMLHNHYQTAGGEDKSFAVEAEILEKNGHEVIRYTRHNDEIDDMQLVGVALATLWNQEVYREVRSIIQRERPDIMHCQNTFPLISPAVYYAAKAEKVPVIQSLRNYRLLCANGYLLRDGHVCEDCIGKHVPWPGIRHTCYRGSRAASTVLVSMQSLHRLLGTWRQMVDVYIALTEFARQKYIEGGLPPEKIFVKPNFIRDPGVGSNCRKFALFVGRLSPEKGIDTLLAAWKEIHVPLMIVGDGPLHSLVKDECSKNRYIEALGRKSEAEVLELMGNAVCLVFPSIWYEGLPRVIIEAYGKGTPVIASNLGSMGTLIKHGHTGLLFSPGDSDDLAAKVKWALEYAREMQRMGEASRREFMSQYTAERNYQMTMEIYEEAIAASRR